MLMLPVVSKLGWIPWLLRKVSAEMPEIYLYE